VAGKLIYKVRGQDDEINGVSWCPQYSITANKILGKQKQKRMESFSASSRMERIRNNLEPSEALEAAIADRKQTKDESLNKQEEEEEVIIPEDDMFDVYKDHEANEFGHKKFEPEDILVKVKDEPKDDFLTECQRLKEAILKNKNEPEESIESLVEAMDKAHVKEVPGDGDKQQDLTQETLETTTETHESTQETQESTQESQEPKQETHENNEYKHLLASVGKYGGVRIWTQTGKLLASCTVLFPLKKDQKDHKNKGPNWPTLHWFKPDSLLLADGKNQVLEANPLNIDAKNKLDWRVVHSLHRRGLYFLSSNAPRVQTPDILADPASHNWVVWTIGQDRNVISYNMKENKKIEVFASCGAFFYDIKPCAYDAGK
ncbi:putative gemin 5, partial [Operophtera brumata]